MHVILIYVLYKYRTQWCVCLMILTCSILCYCADPGYVLREDVRTVDSYNYCRIWPELIYSLLMLLFVCSFANFH